MNKDITSKALYEIQCRVSCFYQNESEYLTVYLIKRYPYRTQLK